MESFEISTYKTCSNSATYSTSDGSHSEGDDTISTGSFSNEIFAETPEESDVYKSRLSLQQKLLEKPPSPSIPKTDILANMKMKRLLRDWNKEARMINFVKDEPTIQPPYFTFNGCYPYSPRPEKARKLENFVPDIDETSIYDIHDPKNFVQGNSAVLHRLHFQSSKPDDYIQTTELPEALKTRKVS